jgi:dTDP-4-dehydrorhamnose reductase
MRGAAPPAAPAASSAARRRKRASNGTGRKRGSGRRPIKAAIISSGFPDGLALWGGPECTVARVGERWRDQLEETGHARRFDDIRLIAELGIKCVRYPVLWERTAPKRPDKCNFAWADPRIERLVEHGIEPIVGLLHHGSGPAYTDLLDPDFPAKLGDYALQVARRYPQVRRWTPVNEPLTTARFACLYGHWYPHRRDYPAFLRAVVNQCLGIREAMRALRSVNPSAELVQTEDLGRIFSTPALAAQAAHENERRWLSLDLLFGRVDGAHPFLPFLLDAGIGEEELEPLADGGGAPGLLGINHYLTSDRFLDSRTELYPSLDPGGNGREVYVDAEAVRVAGLATGIGPRLSEAWERYRRPLAVTEVHHGCTRDEQLRWLDEVWTAARELRTGGVPIEAVTLWSLFGSVDWRSLLTRAEGRYDVGAYDRRGLSPRPTAIAAAAQSYARGERFDHPVLKEKGWWRRPERLYGWCSEPPSGEDEGRPLLITGATGTLGQALARIARHRGLSVSLTSRAELDIADPLSVAAALRSAKPWAVINAAGFVRVADAQREPEACMAANAAGAGNLARACAGLDIPFVTFSSDLVFDGRLGRAYIERDELSPLCVYGESKQWAEKLVLATGARALVVRTSAFFGSWDRYNFAWAVLDHLARGEPFSASDGDIVSPTFVPDLCHAVLDLLIDGETGIWHLANQGETDWCSFARTIAQKAGFDPDLVFARSGERPRRTALASERGALLRPLEEALDDYLRDVEALRTASPPREAAAYSAASRAVGASK